MAENHPNNDPELAQANDRTSQRFFERLESLAALDKVSAIEVAGHSILGGLKSEARRCPVSGLPANSGEPPHSEHGCDGCFRDFLAGQMAALDAAFVKLRQAPQARA